MVYSALRALDLAVTVDFSIEKAISPKAAPAPPDIPRCSAVAVGRPEPNVEVVLPPAIASSSAIDESLSESDAPSRPVGSA